MWFESHTLPMPRPYDSYREVTRLTMGVDMYLFQSLQSTDV